MSDTENMGGFGNTSQVGLIVGIVIVSAVLLTVIVIVIVLVCRHRRRRKRGFNRSRSRNLMIVDGDNNNSPPNQASYGPASADKGVTTGEFRPNPLAEDPFNRPYPPNQGVSLITLPDGGYNYSGQRLANSMQELNNPNQGIENMAFYTSLYENLTDTIHQERGRPLYVCRRTDYPAIASYFDIVGQTRGADWLVRPRSTIPNRPIKKKRPSKKSKAPQPHDSRNSKHSRNSHGSGNIEHSGDRKKSSAENRFKYSSTNGIGGTGRPSSAVIATPFGVAQRGQYLSGSHLNINTHHTTAPNFEPRYTSLPRDGKVQHNSNEYNSRGAAKLHRNISERTPKAPMDEALYTQVVKKNAINQPRKPETQNEIDDMIFYTRAVTLPPRMNGKPQVYTIEESPKTMRSSTKSPVKDQLSPQARERSGSTSTMKSLGITEQFKFLDDFDKFEEKF